jgi:hypothetical protein
VASSKYNSVVVPSSGTYTVSIGGAAGASGWSTAVAPNYGAGGLGTSLTFNLALTSGEVVTAVGGCTGFGNLGGLGFANGGSSGFQPQPTYGSGNTNAINFTPALNGVGGGGGGATALCLSPSGTSTGTTTTGITCTAGEPGEATTPLCSSTSPSSTCVLAIAAGGGGGGTAYSTTTNSLTVNTNCTATAADLNGTGAGGAGTSGTSFTGTWAGTTYAAGNGYYWPGTTGGGGSGTAPQYPTTASSTNPSATSNTGGYVGNGGNGGYASTTAPNSPGAGGGGAGFVGGWADPWAFAGATSVPADANPATSGGYLSGAGSATGCGAGGGSSWSLVQSTVGKNSSGVGSISVLYDPGATSQQTTATEVPIYSSTT